MSKTNTFKVDMNVLLPRIPNFFKTEGGKSIPIQNFDEATLKLVGEQWTNELIKNAQERRAAKAKAKKTVSKTEKK